MRRRTLELGGGERPSPSRPRLGRAGQEWQGANRDPSYLLTGSRLAQFEGWMASATVALTPAERRYYDASLAERGRRESEERERQARIILGQAEKEIADSFVQAAASYRDNPVALHLRAMNMLYEAIKERGSMVIVPSSAVETMGLGGTLATASLGGAKP